MLVILILCSLLSKPAEQNAIVWSIRTSHPFQLCDCPLASSVVACEERNCVLHFLAALYVRHWEGSSHSLGQIHRHLRRPNMSGEHARGTCIRIRMETWTRSRPTDVNCAPRCHGDRPNCLTGRPTTVVQAVGSALKESVCVSLWLQRYRRDAARQSSFVRSFVWSL